MYLGDTKGRSGGKAVLHLWMLMDERLGPFREAAEGQVLGTGDTAREPGKVFPCAGGQTVKLLYLSCML